MRKPTILLDCDGVLVENNRRNVERVNEEFGTDYKFENITDFEYPNMEEEHREYLYEECWHDPELYDEVRVTDEQEDALDRLSWIGDLYVVSSPLVGHIESKYRFLKRHFSRSRIILASDKSVIDGDILIDDGLHNIEDFPGKALIYDRPWNRGKKAAGYPRVHTFALIPEYVKVVLNDG